MPLDIAWVMPDGPYEDQRLENRCEPNQPVSIEELRDLGVLHWHFDPETMLQAGPDGSPSRIEKFCTSMGYANRDQVCCAPGKLPNYEERLKMFFQEHIHEDEEIRLILDGTGYFDVRDRGDRWVRVRVTSGDLLVLPAGIYHRFTMDVNDYTHAMRLFKEAPKWTPINRPCDDNVYRQQYVATLTNPAPANTLGGVADGHLNFEINFPEKFDDVIRGIVKSELRPAAGDLLVVYIAGAHNPTTHESWCPDCVASDPVVAESVAASRSVSTRRTVYVQVNVERSSYLKNPEYPLRLHPLVQLKCVPTLLVFKVNPPDADEPGLSLVARFEDKIDATWHTRV